MICRAIYGHSCIGVSDGFLVLGGINREYGELIYSKDIHLLRDSKWTVVGQLNERVRLLLNSAILKFNFSIPTPPHRKSEIRFILSAATKNRMLFQRINKNY